MRALRPSNSCKSRGDRVSLSGVATSALTPSRLHWLARMPFRRKLALIVGVPSLVALLGSLLALSRVVMSYDRARVLEEANAASSYLIQAAAIQAKERGFTSAALADPHATAARRMVEEMRLEGDRRLDAALGQAQGALRGNKVLSAAYDTLRDTLRQRDLSRAEVDTALARGQRADEELVQAWFDAQTRLIGAERAFGSTLFLAQNPYELVIQYNGSIKANVFEASEFAGRERARIGRFIASGRPISAEGLDELQRWRGVVEENLAAIAQLRANPAMSAPVLQSIDNMETVFLGDYQKARTAIYLASAHREPYPLTTDEWIALSTKSIDSILAVSERIGDEAARISRAQAAFSLANVLLILGMMGMLGLAIVASVFVARHLTRRLRELRAAAERVSQGDYSQPVSEADRKDVSGDEFAELAGVFNTMQDQVEQKVEERTRELSAANERLVVLNAEKDTFLGICSHDLKNPLSGIIGLAGLLETDAEDAAQVREHAADILNSSEFMFELVGNLLDLGAIEQGRLNLHPARIDLGATIDRALESYRRRAADKQIRLVWSAPPPTAIVAADAKAVVQVADNLISNAVKFTPLGGTVEVSVGDGALSSGMVRLIVRDTGPGLSAADQTHLFEKYVRLSARATAGEHSTGLGLSIVKKLVEAMGGTVSCESTLGRGSTFTVELPAGDLPGNSPSPKATGAQMAEGTRNPAQEDRPS